VDVTTPELNITGSPFPQDILTQPDLLTPDQDLIMPAPFPEFSGGNSSTPYVFFVGPRGQTEWDKDQLINFYIHTPKGKTLVCRADHFLGEVSVGDMLEECLRIWSGPLDSLNFATPIIRFKDDPVPDKDLFSFLKNSTFIVTDGELEPEYANHSGKLWQCADCQRGVGYERLQTMEKHNKRHKAMFAANMGNKLGTPKNKATPWGLPPGHTGKESLLAPEPRPASPVPQAGPSGVTHGAVNLPHSRASVSASPKRTILPIVPTSPGPSAHSHSSRP
jgi:hypothetical protein